MATFTSNTIKSENNMIAGKKEYGRVRSHTRSGISVANVTAPQEEGRQKRHLGNENEGNGLLCHRLAGSSCVLHPVSSVKVALLLIRDVVTPDVHNVLGNCKVLCWLLNMHCFYIEREVHTSSLVRDRTQIGHSGCLEPRPHVPGLGIPLRNMSVNGLLVALLYPFGFEAKPKLGLKFRWS